MKPHDHRCTPLHVIEAFERVHAITLDPCSNPYAHFSAAARWYGPPDHVDGLEADWSTYVPRTGSPPPMAWVNPPWSGPVPWAQKCAYEWLERGVTSVIWLPCYPETRAASELWQHASAIGFWRRREHHPLPPHLDTGGRSSQWPNWFGYFGGYASVVAKMLQPRAHVITRWTP